MKIDTMLGEVLILLSRELRKPVPWLTNFQVFRDLDCYFVSHESIMLFCYWTLNVSMILTVTQLCFSVPWCLFIIVECLFHFLLFAYSNGRCFSFKNCSMGKGQRHWVHIWWCKYPHLRNHWRSPWCQLVAQVCLKLIFAVCDFLDLSALHAWELLPITAREGARTS